MIDTGADATVHFFGSAVERHRLTEAAGVTITGGKTQITFGSVGRIKEGTVEDFRIPSLELSNLPDVPWMDVRDVSNALLFLASDEARYITGTTLWIDAGSMTK